MASQLIDLSTDLEDFVKEAVASGRFANVNEVYNAALTSFRKEISDNTATTEQALIDVIDKGLEDLESGRSTKFESKADFIEWSDNILVDARKKTSVS